MKENNVLSKSIALSNYIFDINDWLNDLRKWDLSRQVFRSGTSIGANIHEAQSAESKSDFVHKMNIALKESRELSYWFLLIKNNLRIDVLDYWSSMEDLNNQLTKILVAIINSTKKNMKN